MDNIINVKSQTELSSFSIVFHGSTLDESPGKYGISHLLEHLMCKSFSHLYDDFDRCGISWNAFTSETNVVFYIQGLSDYVNKYKSEFLDCVLNRFDITQEILDIEKKIVLEEYYDSFNSQFESHVLNIFRKKFNRYTAIGFKDDIENISLETVLNHKEKYLSNPSKLINIVDDEKDFIDNMGVQNFSTHFKEDRVVMGNYDTFLELGNDFKNKESIILLSPTLEEDFAELKLITLMLSYNLKSPIINELREKRGLVYSSGMSLDIINDIQFCIYFIALTKEGNSDKVIEIVKDIYSKPEVYITKERFELIKELLYVTVRKNEIERYKNISKFIKQPKFNFEDKVKNISFSDIKRIYEKYFLDQKNWLYSVDKKEFNF
jgi:predicted Zn-dependent peptidase